MERLAESMADRAGDIKIVDTNGMPEKWDVADAVAEGWEWDDVHAWAKSRVKRWDPKNAAEKAKTKQEKRDAEIVDRAKLWESLGLTIGPSMQPACNIDNIAKILEGWEVVQDSVWMCGFTGKVLTNFNTPESPKPREWSDVDDLSLTRLIQSRLDMPKVSVQVVHDAVHLVASQKVVNPLEEFLLKAERSWDGTYRLCSWLSTVFGCDQNTYTSAVGRCWLVSMVARAFRPGCKVDTMPILEGGQGVGKSTALSILGGEFFAECHESITSKDFFGVLHGKWLVEISEMHAFNKGEKERIKGIISCATDRYRVPYGRNTMDHPRRCVFAGTTNRTDWNHDETGARRFWPVECGEIDLEWLRQHRSLLLGEAMVRWRAGEPWWDIPKLEQVDLVERRRIRDTWEETLHERLEPMRRYSTADILEHLLGVEIGRQERRMVLRVREIMILLGWKEVFSKTLDRKTIRSWIKE
jgi:predicted P-loop ATPase